MWEGIDSASLLAVLDEIKAVMPIVIPAVIGLLAFRKGFQFLKQQIKGA